MALQVAELSVQIIETLRPLIGRIKTRDKSLADQLTRAASSCCLAASILRRASTPTLATGGPGSSRRPGVRTKH